MSRRSFKKEKGGGGSPSWMTTFSDLMSLLLTFFILLYSMSSVDSEKFNNISQSLQGALGKSGVLDEGGELIISKNNDGSFNVEDKRDKNKEMYKKVEKYVEERGLDDRVNLTLDPKGVYFDIKEAVLFDIGSADLKDEGKEVLRSLTELFSKLDNEIVIEGHTDDIPIHNIKYSSNWDLSTARAVSVIQYFIEEEHMPPGRMSAVGYGEYKPMVENSNDTNRMINRRVNLLIIFDESEGMKNEQQ